MVGVKNELAGIRIKKTQTHTAMMTSDQYLESLRKMDLKIYMFGKRVENWVDNPIIRPSINSVAMTYKLAQMPEYEELMTATSNLTGKKINRFCAGTGEQGEDAAPDGAEDCCLLPALRGYGCLQRHLLHHL